jgi:HEAT repeat protein
MTLIVMGVTARVTIPFIAKRICERRQIYKLYYRPDDYLEKSLAADHLGDIKSIRSVPVLAHILETSRNGLVRLSCARSLGKIGPPALSAVSVLEKHTSDPFPEMRRIVASALEQITGNTTDSSQPMVKREAGKLDGDDADKVIGSFYLAVFKLYDRLHG